jgi:hypothetical protein
VVLKWFDICKGTLHDWILSSSYENVLRPLYLVFFFALPSAIPYFLICCRIVNQM